MYGTICERTSDSTRWNGVSGSDRGFAAENGSQSERFVTISKAAAATAHRMGNQSP